MSGHPHLQILTEGMRAFADKDMATLSRIFHEDLLWHYASTSVLGGTYHGLDEVFEMFARRAALSGETYRHHVEQAIANDHFVTILGQTRAHRDGQIYEDCICYVYRVLDGKVVEAWGIPGNPEKERAFYG